MISLIFSAQSSDAEYMENLETRGYQAIERSQVCNLASEQLKKLHARFTGLTKEKDSGVFLALCHILLLKVSVSTLKKADSESEYFEAYTYLDKFNLDKSPFGEALRVLLGSRPANEVMLFLSHFYEEGMKKTERATLGAFYTPVSYCRDALERVQLNSRKGTLYDPFCGAGAWLFAHLISGQPTLFAADNIPVYGTDIDRTAVILARLNLSLLLPRTNEAFVRLCRQIRVIDSLYSDNSDAKIMSEFMEAADIVATNPPYGFPVDTNSPFFRTDLPRVPDKEVFYYAIEKVRRSLHQRKTAIFLVPNTVLLNLGSKDFRRHLAERYDVTVWDHSGSEVFESAHVRTALLRLTSTEKKLPTASYSASFNEKPNKLDHIDFVDGRIKKDGQQRLFSEQTIELGSIFEVSQGLIPYDKYRGHTPDQIKNRVYHSDKRLSPEHRKELQGRDISSFSVKWSGTNWIKYGQWLAAPRSPKFFREQRTLIREITCAKTGRLHCAYTDEEFYNTPSIINVIHREKGKRAEKELKTLAVFLSSSIYASYHLENSPKAKKGIFPKILVNDVRRLPLPANFREIDLSSIYNRAAVMASNGLLFEKIATFVDEAVGSALGKKTRRAA